jgi:hypothetical protein
MKKMILAIAALMSIGTVLASDRCDSVVHEINKEKCKLRVYGKNLFLGQDFKSVNLNLDPAAGSTHPKLSENQSLNLKELKNPGIVHNLINTTSQLTYLYRCSEKYPNLVLTIGSRRLDTMIGFDDHRFSQIHNSTYGPVELLDSVEMDLRLWISSLVEVTGTSYALMKDRNTLNIEVAFGTSRLGKLSFNKSKLEKKIQKSCMK